MNKNFILSLLMFCLVLTSRASADHLEGDQLAKGRVEHIFCGVNVYKTNASEAIKIYGKPTTIEIVPLKDSVYPPAGDKNYIWKKPGLKMELYTGFYIEHQKTIESVASGVDVWGEKPRGQIGVTGQGLVLGDSIAKVEKIYGKKFYKNKNVNSGLTYVEVQWQDGTQLMIDFNRNEKINHMQLAAETE